MGAHPRCPSPVVGNPGGATDLYQLLTRLPALAGGRPLPYLFKLLSAAEPLSLQSHPDAQQAEQGFARENAAGIPVDASHRNYKDPHHKPELILAYGDFSALCGFLPYDRILARLRHYHLDDLLPAVRPLSQQPDERTLAALFASFFEMSSSDRERAVRRVTGRARLDIQERTSRSSLGHWLMRLTQSYGSDPGILAALLLHHVKLRPGEALFLPAGVLHSYLGGTGLEIMASSDNVLRGGLTSKHVDVGELLATLDFRPFEPNLVRTKTTQVQPGAHVTTYVTPAKDFRLSLINITTGAQYVSRGPDILLVLDGVVLVESGGETQELRKGGQVFCSADAQYSVTGSARLAQASVQGQNEAA